MRVYLVTTNYIKQYCFKSHKKALKHIEQQSNQTRLLFNVDGLWCYIDDTNQQQYFINCYKPK